MHFLFKNVLFVAHALFVILTSASKSTNSLGYCELREPIRVYEIDISFFGKYLKEYVL